jgi:hypothetical protein
MTRGLVRKNNLSDLPSPEQARINLGLASADLNRIRGLFSSAYVQSTEIQCLAGSSSNFQNQINDLNSTLSGIVPSLYVTRSGDTIVSGWTNTGLIRPSFLVQSGTILSGSTDSLFTLTVSGTSYPLSTTTLVCNSGLTVQSFTDNGNVVFASGITVDREMPVMINGVQFYIEAGVGINDADAIAYIAAVEAADGQTLENGVKFAIHDFVTGCKADGIWNAIKASCILSGARTLAGALQPLAGTAPTNNGPFVTGDYNRKTGLIGNASSKYLNSNRNNNADPQNSKHVSVFIQSRGATLPIGLRFIAAGDATGAGDTLIANDVSGGFYTTINSTSFDRPALTTGFVGMSRAISTSYSFRGSNATTTFNRTSGAPRNQNIGVFANSDGTFPLDCRLAFYSIGESLDLALLDARVSALISAFGVAIP